MGLALEVGICADLARHDAEGLARCRVQLEAVNRALAAAGLPPHREPEDLAEGRVFASELWGYSGLHRLRRVAAHLALGRPLPPPQRHDAPDDPTVDAYNVRATASPNRGLLDRILRRRPALLPYQHLMLHSDAEGFYLPADFAEVLFPDPELKIAGGMIGSSPRLLAECRSLAEALALPLDLDPEDDDLLEAAQAQDPAAEGWRRYGVESLSCVRLAAACEASLATGAALVFC